VEWDFNTKLRKILKEGNLTQIVDLGSLKLDDKLGIR
jgi:hypothetical protein